MPRLPTQFTKELVSKTRDRVELPSLGKLAQDAL